MINFVLVARPNMRLGFKWTQASEKKEGKNRFANLAPLQDGYSQVEKNDFSWAPSRPAYNYKACENHVVDVEVVVAVPKKPGRFHHHRSSRGPSSRI